MVGAGAGTADKTLSGLLKPKDDDVYVYLRKGHFLEINGTWKRGEQI